jgi:hypothetical protein
LPPEKLWILILSRAFEDKGMNVQWWRFRQSSYLFLKNVLLGLEAWLKGQSTHITSVRL